MEGQQFFEKYESCHQALINAAELYIKADSSGMLHILNNDVLYMYACMPMVLLNGSLVTAQQLLAKILQFHPGFTVQLLLFLITLYENN